ncbi:MAG: response regulator transcription factor [Oscillospiraceae bacterium]|nr:response regulator transcription factor [Oscillospiraceae bacterium]
MKRVLVCEDEDNIREVIVFNLKRERYDVVDVSNGEDALKAFDEANGNFDIALLDIMLPGIDGLTVLKRLREKSKTLGIIMLTAKSQEMDKAAAYMSEVDDYITKPFSSFDLTVRVEALYRRVIINSTATNEVRILESGPFSINHSSRTVTKNGVPIELTDVEYKIMSYFIKNKNTLLDRASILANVWSDNYYGDNKIVDVNIRRLRMKIEDDPSNPQFITTRWGYGYIWQDGPEAHR